MPDDLPLALLGRLLRPLGALVEVLFEALLDALFNRISYLLGWLALRVVTLGRRPRGPAFPQEFSGNDWLIQLVGVLVILAALIPPIALP